MHLGFELDEDFISFWETHQWHPHGDFDYIRHEHENTCDPWQFFAMALKDHKAIRACAIGRIQKLPLRLQFGYKIFKGPSSTTLVVHESGFIGHWDVAGFQFLMESLRNLLAMGMVDALLFRMLPLDSPLHSIARSLFPFFRRDHFRIVQDCWALNQLDSFEAFLGARHTLRRNFRTYGNRIARAFSNKVEIKCYRNPAELDRMLQDSEEVGRKIWQRKLGEPSFLDREERFKYEFYVDQGWYRGYVLYLDGIPAAYRHGIVYKDVFYVGRTGYDPNFRHLGLGTYLLVNVIKDYCGTGHIRVLDFAAGNAEDKRQYCNVSFAAANIHVFGPKLRLVALNSLRLTAQAGHQLAKTLLHRFGWYESVRKQWRSGS